jgi:hypothetical protein
LSPDIAFEKSVNPKESTFKYDSKILTVAGQLDAGLLALTVIFLIFTICHRNGLVFKHYT